LIRDYREGYNPIRESEEREGEEKYREKVQGNFKLHSCSRRINKKNGYTGK